MFEFATAQRIVFGCGTLPTAAKAAREYGSTALVVTGRDAARAARFLQLLSAEGLTVSTFSGAGEPTIEAVMEGAHAARANGVDVVIGFGGGSAIDAAKAIAALATNRGEPLDYLEVIGRGQPLRNAPLPTIAIPTTAGTGAEVTRNAVLASPNHRVKVSLRSAMMLPRLALVDPELTFNLPPAVTAASGMDAFTQLIEAFLSSRANILTDALCRDAIPKAAVALQMFSRGAGDQTARVDLAYASLCSGLALANSGLGAVHGFAAPLGGMYGTPHGEACARLLAPVLQANLGALQERAPESRILDRFTELSELVSDDEWHDPQWIIHFSRQLAADFKIRRLSEMSVPAADIGVITAAAAQTSSMRGNPIPLTPDELGEALGNAM